MTRRRLTRSQRIEREQGERMRDLYRSGWSVSDLVLAYNVGVKDVVRTVEPQKHRARVAAARAIAAGDLQRPECCEECGDSGDIQAHHPDYSRPFSVRFLCAGCHGSAHRGGQSGFSRVTAEERKAIWAVALAQQVTWAELLDAMTVSEIVDRYRRYLGHGQPTLAEADTRDPAARDAA